MQGITLGYDCGGYNFPIRSIITCENFVFSLFSPIRACHPSLPSQLTILKHPLRLWGRQRGCIGVALGPSRWICSCFSLEKKVDDSLMVY